MDPPYDCGYERAVLEYLSNSAVADKDALIIVEASNDTDFDWIDTLGYRVIKYKRYKNNCHLFLKRESDFKEADNEECDLPGQL
jgi:16S rRNA (guanine966-N2)-methyltransferase